MALKLMEESGPKLTSRPAGGYSQGVTTVASNKLALANDYTRDRRGNTLKVPLTPDRNRRGSKGGSASKSPRLRSATRTIVS